MRPVGRARPVGDTSVTPALQPKTASTTASSAPNDNRRSAFRGKCREEPGPAPGSSRRGHGGRADPWSDPARSHATPRILGAILGRRPAAPVSEGSGFSGPAAGRHSTASANILRTCLNCSAGGAPSTSCPLMMNDGVARTPNSLAARLLIAVREPPPSSL